MVARLRGRVLTHATNLKTYKYIPRSLFNVFSELVIETSIEAERTEE